jgi:hypothetical protein
MNNEQQTFDFDSITVWQPAHKQRSRILELGSAKLLPSSRRNKLNPSGAEPFLAGQRVLVRG